MEGQGREGKGRGGKGREGMGWDGKGREVKEIRLAGRQPMAIWAASQWLVSLLACLLACFFALL